MKRVLHYVYFEAKGWGPSYVVCTYTDGSTRTWYEGEDRGFKAAKAKAMKAKKDR